MAVDVPKWSTMKEVLRELRKPEVQEKFHTIIIDTATIAYELCEQHTCIQHDVQELSEIPWGKGYKLTAKEFNLTMRQIINLGYGLVFIAHSGEKSVVGGDEGETLVYPELEKRAYKIINGLVDVIAYIDVDHDTGNRNLITRSNRNVVAGSRFKFLAEKIPLGYEELVNALVDAIEKEGKEKGQTMILDERLDFLKETKPFKQVMSEARALWGELIDKDETLLVKMREIIKNHFGEDILLSQAKETQQELVELVIMDLKDLR